MSENKLPSPSSWPALMQCGQYESSPFESNDASIGTEMHRYCLEFKMPELFGEPNDKPFVSMVKDVGDEQIEACDTICQKLYDECIESGEAFSEARYELEVKGPDYRGRLDFLYMPILADFKSGLDFRPHLHYHRPQLSGYAAVIMEDNCMEKMLCAEVFIMPGKLNLYWITLDEAKAIAESVRQKHGVTPPQCCQHCTMCAKLLRCPAVNRQIKMVGELFQDLKAPENIMSPDKITDPKEMSVALTFVKNVLKGYAKKMTDPDSKSGIKERVEAAALLMSEKETIPYYIRKVTASKRKVVDVSGAIDAFEKSGLQKKDLFPALSFTLDPLKRIVQKCLGIKTLKESEQLAKGILDPFMDNPEPRISMEFNDEQ